MSSSGHGSGSGAPPGGGQGSPPGGGWGSPPPGWGPPPPGWGPPPPPAGGGWGAPPPPPGGGGWGAPPGHGGAGWPRGPEPTPPPGYPPAVTPALEGGVPWEQTTGSVFTRWWETVKAVNNDTRAFFSAAAQNESSGAITFAMMTGAMVGLAIGLLYLVIFTIFGAAIMAALSTLGARGSASPGASVGAGALAAGIGFGVGLIYAVIITAGATMGAAIRPFLWGGIHHVVLLMLGGVGERKTFMHTARVAAYTEGASLAWVLIPIAGPFLAAIFGVKNLLQGYDETHRCGIGKALLAVFAPFLCCCLCYLLIAAMGLAGSLGAASSP